MEAFSDHKNAEDVLRPGFHTGSRWGSLRRSTDPQLDEEGVSLPIQQEDLGEHRKLPHPISSHTHPLIAFGALIIAPLALATWRFDASTLAYIPVK